jgi:hypothetical protein
MIFTLQDLRSRFHEQPFTPVRIVTTTNQTYDVYHPDMVLIASHFLIVGTPGEHGPDVAEAVTRIALVHITELRDLPTPAA